jgi:hypothetical protein
MGLHSLFTRHHFHSRSHTYTRGHIRFRMWFIGNLIQRMARSLGITTGMTPVITVMAIIGTTIMVGSS